MTGSSSAYLVDYQSKQGTPRKNNEFALRCVTLKVMVRYLVETCGFKNGNYMKRVQFGVPRHQMENSIMHLQCFVLGVRDGGLVVLFP